MKAYPLPKDSDLILKFQKVKHVIFGENAVSLIGQITYLQIVQLIKRHLLEL